MPRKSSCTRGRRAHLLNGRIGPGGSGYRCGAGLFNKEDMKRPRVVLFAVLCAGLVAGVSATAIIAKQARGSGGAPEGPPVSPEVRQMLHDVSVDRIQQTIAKLVSFGTRNTLSSQTDPNRGIGAATNWVLDQFQQAAAASDGRMTVEKQSFVQPPGPRNPTPVTVTNVIATLHGTQPESANRTYMVSGHLDTRCTDVLNFQCDAPAADDDGSGVAAVLELARVMATHKFDATIKFVTFAGEEQGLFGSTFFANQAKQQGLNIAGMFSNDIIGRTLGQSGERDTRESVSLLRGRPATRRPRKRRFARRWGARTTHLPVSSPVSSTSRRSEQCRK
jgi:hypothetical protein